jgi:hypothetical protein
MKRAVLLALVVGGAALMDLPTASASPTPTPHDYNEDLAAFLTHMIIWHVSQPIRSSGNAGFDDSVQKVLQKLVDERTPLPDPPSDRGDAFRGRTVDFSFSTQKLRPLVGC